MKGYMTVANYQILHVRETLKRWQKDGVAIDPASSDFQNLLRTLEAITAKPLTENAKD